MRTNIVLDDKLVRDAMKITGAKTKRQVVHVALEQLVKRRGAGAARIERLAGQDMLDPKYDVRAVRRKLGRGAR